MIVLTPHIILCNHPSNHIVSVKSSEASITSPRAQNKIVSLRKLFHGASVYVHIESIKYFIMLKYLTLKNRT